MTKLSVCITVYNQLQVAQNNIENILNYEGNDIEIVIQDDCSTDDYQSLLQQYDDPRIKYYRNAQNLGHDRNIIEGLKNCKSDYAFLLRSSDSLIPEKIPEIIRFIEENEKVGYCRFSCVDENLQSKVSYDDQVSGIVAEAVQMNNRLLIHPSGELYNLSYFGSKDWDRLLQYLDRYFNHNLAFIVHALMRDKLSAEAPLATSSSAVWIYSDTASRKDKAVNRSKNGTCVYAPQYQYERLECELDFLMNELEDAEAVPQSIRNTLKRYSKAILCDFKFTNGDKRMQQHYGFSEVSFSSLKEVGAFKDFIGRIMSSAKPQYKELFREQLEDRYYKKLLIWHLEWWAISFARRLPTPLMERTRKYYYTKRF